MNIIEIWPYLTPVTGAVIDPARMVAQIVPVCLVGVAVWLVIRYIKK